MVAEGGVESAGGVGVEGLVAYGCVVGGGVGVEGLIAYGCVVGAGGVGVE